MKADELDLLPDSALFSRIVSDGRWLCPNHLAYIGRALDDVAEGRCKRLMIFVPPRHGKSEFVSRYFPAHFLRKHPHKKIILASYEASFAEHWGEQARDTWLLSGEVFGLSRRLKKSRGNWWSIFGDDGYMTTAGAGGPITGKGMDLGIIDDPIKNSEEAYSKTKREAIWQWYLSTFRTRLEPGGAIILMMTRWHHDDLAGRILKNESEKWRVIRLPALAEENDPIGRAPGEALWPERFPVEDLEPFRKSDRWWNALYQQQPLTAEGNIVRRDWFKVIDAIPDGFRHKARAWDLAATASAKADFLCGTKIERVNDMFIITDVARSRINASEVIGRIKAVAQQDSPSVQVGVEQEPGASGKITVAHIAAELAGYRIIPLSPSGSKEYRALPFLDQARAGNVYLLRGPWNDNYLSEIESFPVGEKDDQVDTSAYAFNMIAKPQWVGFSLPPD